LLDWLAYMATTTQKERIPLAEEVQATIKRLEAKDPGLKQLLKKSYAYAIFPNVGKAGLVIGGSYGRGAVYEKGKLVGYATIGQTTIGVQVGGITFTEVLAFENRQAFDRFKQGGVKFAAGASAVLVKAGAAGQADYEKGVIALAYSKGGMLLEASIGGQKFKFKPKDGQEQGGAAEGKAGKSKGRGRTSEEDEDSEQDSEGDEDGSGVTGLAGRAMGGVRDAASGVTGLVKKHPWTSAAVGTGVAAGVALLVMRAMRQAGSGSSDGDDADDSESDEDRDQEEDQGNEEAEDSGASDEADESDEDHDESDSGGDEDEEEQSPRRSRSGGRARSRS
jgi:lipid-binding SYLF domain-containing protein